MASSVSSLVGVETLAPNSSWEPLPFSRSVVSCAVVGVDVRTVEADGDEETDVDEATLKSWLVG